MRTISYCTTLEPTEWCSLHMWWGGGVSSSHLCSGNISGPLQPSGGTPDVTHFACECFFFCCFIFFKGATGQFGWIFHAEIWNLAYAVLLSLKAQCPAIMWHQVWWSLICWQQKKKKGMWEGICNRILCNRPVCNPVCGFGCWQWII